MSHQPAASKRAETIEDRLRKIEDDLGSIVRRMNKDRQPDVALKAQHALLAVDALARDFDAGEFEWDWEPTGDE